MKSEVADFQRVVEALRDLRASNVLILNDEVRRYATDYAALCRSANERLRQISTLLQQGFRSEAIHLAEEPPNLLELVAALDLPEPEIWAEFCQQHDIPVPPPLQLDRASQLNDAYEQDQPLKALLSKHRRLALSRASVRRRLDVMRQIYDLDPSAPFWDADLRAFERARFAEMMQEFYAAMKARDIRAVQTLAEELSQTPWLETPPEPLKSNVEQANSQIEQAVALIELKKLIGPLRDAYAARDLEGCRQLLQQCRDILAVNSQIQVPNDLVTEIQPASDWIKREDQLRARQAEIDQACARLEQAIRSDLTDSELAEAYEGIRVIAPVPPELETRYREMIAARQRTRQSARTKKIALIATIVVVLSGLGGLIAYQFMQSSAATGWARDLRKAVADKDIPKARQVIKDQERLAPGLNTHAAIIAAKRDARTLETKFESDTEVLNTLLASLNKSADSAVAITDATNPAPDDLVRAAETATAALQEAKQAPDLSWVDRDQRVKTATSRLEQLKTAAAQKLNATVMAKIDELNRTVESTSANGSSAELDAAAGKIGDAMAQARGLSRVAGIDDAAKTAAENIVQAAQKKSDEIQKTHDQLAAIKILQEKPTSAQEIKTMLDDFAAKYPEAPITADFTKASQIATIGQSLEAWRDLAVPWGGKISPGGAPAALKRIESIDAYLKANPASPLAPQIAGYKDYLKQASDALSEKGPWQTAFGELLANPLLTDIQSIDATNGKETRRYWILGAFKKTDRRLGDRGDIEFEIIDPKNLTKRRPAKLPPPWRFVTDKPVAAPHTVVAHEMASQIKLIDESNWATWGIDSAEKLAKNSEMDPVVKALLMQQVLKTTRQVAGWGVGDLYDKPIRDLARHELENVCWYDPDHPIAPSVKSSIQAVMDGIPPASNAKAMLKAKESEFTALLGFTYTCTGIVMKDPAGAWKIYAPGTYTEGFVAWAVRPAQNPPDVSAFIPIAQYKQGQFVLNESVVQTLPQGTMVVVRKP